MRAATSIATVAVALFLLSGCTPQPSPATPTPTASSTPVFASDEEALAAATAAYAAYLAVSDQILNEGGAEPDRIDSVVESEELRSSEKAGFANFRDKGYRSTGTTTFSNVVLQQLLVDATSGTEIVRVYLCSDVTDVNVFDETNTSVVSPSRPALTAFEVGFNLRTTAPLALVVSSKSSWEGRDPCV